MLSMTGMVNSEEIGNRMVGKVTLPRDGKGGGLDGSEDFGAGFRIKLMSVEAQGEPFPNGLDLGLGVAFSEGCLHEGAVGVPHSTAHDEPFFTGPLHEHGAVALIYFRWCITHIHTVRDTNPF